ncbi:right-handed parallel beta-helix repeat-containing protein, partial [bacterium]|nr:right-handed parallel beta-helix repeat-containing protein [bacterium]
MHIKHSIYFFILVLVVTILYSATSLAKDNVAFVNVKDYGAVGDGTTNDTAAIQAAVDALPVGGSIIFPAGIYAINDMIILSRKKSVSIEGNQATLLQTTGHKRSLWIDKSDHVVVKNLRVERNEYTDYTGAFSDSKGIYITESHHVSVLYSAFIGFGYSGVSWYLSDYIHIEGNHIVGPGSSIPSQGNYCYGVNSYSTPSSYGHIKILNNTISDVAIGIFVGEQEDVVISGNEITDIPGQHGMYLATSNSVISNNTLKNIELDGIKVQIGQKATKDINNVIITSNSIKNVGNTGIDLNQYESSLYYFTNAQISNNSVYQGSYGIVAKGQKNMKISNNAL